MKRMKKSFLEKGRKIFSYLVITAMLFGMLPVNSMQAFAAGGEMVSSWPYAQVAANEFDAVYQNQMRNFEGSAIRWENGTNLGYTCNNDTLVFNDVDFGNKGPASFIANAAGGQLGDTQGKITVKIDCTVAEDADYIGGVTHSSIPTEKCLGFADDVTGGTTIAEVIFNSNDFSDYADRIAYITENVTGVHDVYIILGMEAGALNIKNFAFTEKNDTPDPVEKVTVTYAAGENGTIRGTAVQEIDKTTGTTTEVTAVPNQGYAFDKWSDGKTEASRTDTGITENVTYTASFKLAETEPEEAGILAKFTFDDSTDGFSYTGTEGKVVAEPSQENMTFSEDSAVSVENGKSLSFDGTDKTGYLSVKKEDGSPLLTGKNTFAISYYSKPGSTTAQYYGWAYNVRRAFSDGKWDFGSESNWGFNNNLYYIGVQDKLDGLLLERCHDIKTETLNSAGNGEKWKHVLVQYEANKTTVYVNGVKTAQSENTQALKTLSETLGDKSDFKIARADYNTGEYYSGNLDEFTVYDGVVSEKTIQDLAAATKVELTDAYKQNNAEGFSEQSGVRVENSPEAGGHIGWINSGSWVKYANIDFGDLGAAGFDLRYAIPDDLVDTSISLMIDSRDPEIATAAYEMALSKTGGWQTYETKTIDLGGEPLTGVHDVYIVFNGQMNVDWWQFKEKNDTPDPVLPTAPQNFTAAAGDGEAALSWTAPANSGDVSAITKYEVSSDNGESWVDAASNTGHTFTGLTNGTEYTFQVRAVNADGNGAAATVKATPMAPIITGWPYETRIANEFDAVYPNKDRNPNFQSQPMKWENNSNIGYTTNGDTLVFTDVNFGSRGADKFIAEVAAGVSQGSQGPCAGKIIVKVDCTVAENASYTGIKDASIPEEKYLGNSTDVTGGTTIATLEVTGDGFNPYIKRTAAIAELTGTHDVFIILELPENGAINIKSFAFTQKGVEPDPQPASILAKFDFDDEAEGFSYTGKDGEVVAEPSQDGGMTFSDDSAVSENSGKSLSFDGTDKTGFLNVKKADGSPLMTGKESFAVSYYSKPSSSTATYYGWVYNIRRAFSDGKWDFGSESNYDYTNNLYYLGAQDKPEGLHVERCFNTKIETPDIYANDDGKWKHVLVQYEANKTTVYVNGTKAYESEKPETLKSISETLGDNSDFKIARADWNQGEFYSGLLDEFTIYEGVVSNKEILDLAAAKKAEPRNAFKRNEAELFDETNNPNENVQGETTLEYVEEGNWFKYADVDFGKESPVAFEAQLSSGANTEGSFELRLDSPEGTLVGTVTYPGNSDYTKYGVYSQMITQSVTGRHDLYIVFNKSGQANLDWWRFYNSRNPYAQNNAESFTDSKDVRIDNSAEAGGHIGYINEGSWVKYAYADFGTFGATHFDLRYAIPNDLADITVDLMIDSMDKETATKTYTLNLTKTGGWQTYETCTIELPEKLTGKHDVYLVFHGQVNVDWWQFKELPEGAVIRLISAIPEEVTLEDEAAVKAAREAYDALTSEQKAVVDKEEVNNGSKIAAAEAIVKPLRDQAEADRVIELIAAISTPVTLADEAAVKAARKGYDALTKEQKAIVDKEPANNNSKITAAEAALIDLKDQAAAKKVIGFIAAIPTPVTLSAEAAVKKARKEYDALTKEQKAIVDAEKTNNSGKITAAEAALIVLKDQAAVDKVVAILDSVEPLMLDSLKAIVTAREEYGSLTQEQKELFNNMKALQRLENYEKAYEVLRKISEINTPITAGSKAAIEEARKAYDLLDAAQKKLLELHYKTLVKAEADYKAITEVKVEETDISKASVSAIPVQNFTGKALTPGFTVTMAGKVLVKDRDYTVAYKNNVKIGTATVTITGKLAYKGTLTKTFTITVRKGKTYVSGKYRYTVTNANLAGKGTVTVKGVTSKKLKTIKVPSTVSIGGKKFKVTKIGASAFKGCRTATKATIGKYVKTIGKNAFYKASKLKTIYVNSAVLKKVEKNAFKGINGKAKIKVPKKKYAKYRKYLSRKGQKSTVRIVK